MKIALSTHLLAYHKFELHFADWIREAGFQAVEMWCMNPHFAYRDLNVVEQTRKRFEQVGIRAHSIHLPFYLHLDLLRQKQTLSPLARDAQAREFALKEAEAAIDAAAMLGADVAVLHLGETGEALEPENQELSLQAIDRLGKKAAQKNVRVALENIQSKLTDIQNLRILIERTGMKNVGICVDVGHSQVWKDPLSDLKLANELLINTHLHDNDGKTDEHKYPGQGCINWAELLVTFRDLGYRGGHSLEIRDQTRGGTLPSKLLQDAALTLRPTLSTWDAQTEW